MTFNPVNSLFKPNKQVTPLHSTRFSGDTRVKERENLVKRSLIRDLGGIVQDDATLNADLTRVLSTKTPLDILTMVIGKYRAGNIETLDQAAALLECGADYLVSGFKLIEGEAVIIKNSHRIFYTDDFALKQEMVRRRIAIIKKDWHWGKS